MFPTCSSPSSMMLLLWLFLVTCHARSLVQESSGDLSINNAEQNEETTPTIQVGESHGTAFDDRAFAADGHHRIGSITLYGCSPSEHVLGVSFGWRTTKQAPVSVRSPHGTTAGPQISSKELILKADESIRIVYLRTWKQKEGFSRRTRIGYLKFEMNGGASIECGVAGNDDPSFAWIVKDSALLYMSGSEGDALDALVGHYIMVNHY